jgi:hypothetical protein
MKRILILIALVALAGVTGVVVRSSRSETGTVAEIRELVSHNAGTDVREEVRQKFELTPGARVELMGLNGAVNIETSDTTTADVYIERLGSSQEALNRRKVYIEADAGSLRIHVETVEHSFFAKLFGSKTSERATLKLPRQISLIGKGINGAFTAGDIDGAVQLTGINGRVQVAGAKGTALLKGINGNIAIGFKSIEQEGVTLNGINGNIVLQLPPGLNADFDARGINGQVISDVPTAAIDRSKRGSFWGRIGNGGNGITAKGINGNIRLTLGSATAETASAKEN